MKFGTLVPSRGYTATPKLMLRVAKEAESLGYDYIAVGDHIHFDRHSAFTVGPGTAMLAPGSTAPLSDPMMWESITTLTYLAAVTKSIHLATHVLLLTARASPVVLGKQIACLDALSNGRCMFGVGVGSEVGRRELEEILGVRWDQRGKLADEYIRAMVEIWTKDEASFEGEYIRFEKAVIYPKPASKPYPPIWIGGGSLAAIRRAARLGDGWCPPSSSQPPVEKLSMLKDEMARVGRSKAKMDIVGASHTCIAKNSEDARRLVAKDPYEPTRQKEFASHQGIPVEKLVSDRLIGSPSEIIKKVEPFADAGFTHFHTANFYYDSDDSLINQIRLFAKEVMPSF